MAERRDPRNREPAELSEAPARSRRSSEVAALATVASLALVLGLVALVATGSRRDVPPTGNPTMGPQRVHPTSCDAVMDPYFETPHFARLHPALATEQAAHDGELCLTAAQRTSFEREQAGSQATAPTVKPGPLPVAPPNTAPPPDGIRDEGQSFGPASTLVPTNEWNRTNDEGTLSVIAGARGTDNRGGVVVVHWAKDQSLDEVHPYDAPAGLSALRITREIAPSQLELTTDDGRVVYFDYGTRAFSTPEGVDRANPVWRTQ